MNRSNAEAITSRLLSNVAGLKYGSVSVTFKVHDGRIMDVTHTVTESVKESGLIDSGAGTQKKQ